MERRDQHRQGSRRRRKRSARAGWLPGFFILAFGFSVLASLAHAPGPDAVHAQRAAGTTPGWLSSLFSDTLPLYLPLVQRQALPPGSDQTPPATVPPGTPTSEATLVWDPRLDQRFTELIEADAQPGEAYWKLVRAVWYDEEEAQGTHHIFVDVIDGDGNRMAGVPVRFYWNDGEVVRNTEAKPGESYALNFDMHDVAPSYGAHPHNGSNHDTVWGMGLGDIERPFHTIHTSYGLVWQWTVKSEQGTPPTATPTPIPADTATPTPTGVPAPARDWDPRLDQRGTELTEASVDAGDGYWRLVRGRWLNAEEAGGRSQVRVDVIDGDGNRVVGVPIRFYWNGGEVVRNTEQKPGESYAVDFGMTDVAPSYGAHPNDANPRDSVWGMGLGSLEHPDQHVAASYEFVWQWTIEQGEQSPSPSATPTPTSTPSTYLFNRADLVRCDPNAGITYVEGTVRLNGAPANGYRVVFSYAPDGEIVAGVTSGPHEGYEGWDPGHYSHILQAHGPREGDWWFWIVDGADQRISQLAHVHTDGVAHASSCQQAVIDFDSE